jgi:hypothetical protein
MNVWIHIAVVVNGNSILSYRDSQVAPADGYGFFSGWPRDTNSAYPNPQALTSTFGAFDMHSNIHLGSRTDHNADRHFLGRMAGLTIASEAMSSGQVSCVFTATAPIPPSTSGSTTTAAQQPGGHIPCVQPVQLSGAGMIDFTDSYQNNTMCQWTVTCPAGNEVALRIDSLDVEQGYAYLDITTGTTGAQVAHLTGSTLPNPATFTSAGQTSAIILFTSDGSIASRGFQLSYACSVIHMPPPRPPPRDYTGSWSSCDADCKRAWTQTTARMGSGASCPPAPTCAPGDGRCSFCPGRSHVVPPRGVHAPVDYVHDGKIVSIIDTISGEGSNEVRGRFDSQRIIPVY